LTCRKGYELALEEGAAWIFQIDSDGQCDPKFFRSFYSNRAAHDCLFGYRRTRDDDFGRIVVSHCCRLLLWLMTGTYLKDPNVPYRLMRAKALKVALGKVPTDFELQNIGLALALKQAKGSSWKSLPIHFRRRRGGKSSLNYGRSVTMGMDLLCDIRRISHESSHSRVGKPLRSRPPGVLTRSITSIGNSLGRIIAPATWHRPFEANTKREVNQPQKARASF
jgi:dolichol-phosphate mannosyltransferase